MHDARRIPSDQARVARSDCHKLSQNGHANRVDQNGPEAQNPRFPFVLTCREGVSRDKIPDLGNRKIGTRFEEIGI